MRSIFKIERERERETKDLSILDTSSPAPAAPALLSTRPEKVKIIRARDEEEVR